MLQYSTHSPNLYTSLVELIIDNLVDKEYPHCLKTSVVIPLPKIKVPTNVCDYRPCILLQSQTKFSKLFEK